MHLFKAPSPDNSNIENILYLLTLVTFIRDFWINLLETFRELYGEEYYKKESPTIKILSVKFHCAFFLVLSNM